MESLQSTEQVHTEPVSLSESSDVIKKAKRVLSEKQREALKAGCERPWKRMFEALENQTELNKALPLTQAKAIFLQNQSKYRKIKIRYLEKLESVWINAFRKN